MIEASLEREEARQNLPYLVEAAREEEGRKGHDARSADDGCELNKAVRIELSCGQLG